MSTVRTNNLTRASGSGMPDLGGVSAGKLTASAWINFNGVGTVAIRNSYNVSSIVDLGVGLYDLVFTAPMVTNTYTAVALAGQAASPGNGLICNVYARGVNGCTFGTGNPQADAIFADVVIFGGRA